MQAEILSDYGPIGVAIAGMLALASLFLKSQSSIVGDFRKSIAANVRSSEKIAQECHDVQKDTNETLREVATAIATVKTLIERMDPRSYRKVPGPVPRSETQADGLEASPVCVVWLSCPARDSTLSITGRSRPSRGSQRSKERAGPRSPPHPELTGGPHRVESEP